jgi:formylglycine-generating enzyme required for sulfatase activity
MLTGKSPRAMRERELPEAWRELVFRMAESVPEGRYADLRAVRVELQELDVREAPKPPISVVAAAPVVPATPTISRSSRPATPLVHTKPAVAGDVSSWAEVLKASVDRSIVTDARLADQITAVGLPWRVYDRVTGIEMVLIPPGSFWKGALPDDAEAFDNEWPFHKVTITRAFYLAVYPVKQSEWTRLMGVNPSDFPGAPRPVENVSWDDAMAFCLKSGGSLRLPTEAEWEYACRAGTPASRYGNLDDIAWYDVNSARKTQDVGGLRANPLGLHDMLGNVWEWCSDWYGAYSSEAQVNPQGPNKGQSRVYRGGAWDVNFRRCRASRRDHYASNVTRNSIGFRVARTT